MKEKATLIFVVCRMTILASRLRAGHKEWDPVSEFFKGDDWNMTGGSLFHDGKGVLHHVNGMGRKGLEGWADLAMLHRYSRDRGITWSVAHPISTDTNDQRRHQVIAGMKRIGDGALIQPCDATTGSPRRVLNAPCNRRWSERCSLLDRDHAESRGHLIAVQTGDGMIHLFSSETHYAFNLVWLKAEKPTLTQNEKGLSAL